VGIGPSKAALLESIRDTVDYRRFSRKLNCSLRKESLPQCDDTDPDGAANWVGYIFTYLISPGIVEI
jgi:hypothetical protein